MIGNFVHYVRQLASGEFSQGWGFVKAVSVNPDNRPIVLIHDAEQPEQSNTFNVDLLAVNATPEFRAEYKAMMVDVQRIADEANALIAKTAADANAQIAIRKTEVLGQAIEFKRPSDEIEQAA